MHWNLGGWLGAQLGGSAWLLVAGLLALNHHVPTALAVLMLFGVVNVYGAWLWQRRATTQPGNAIQRLLFVLAVASLLTVLVLDQAAIYESIQAGGRISAKASYAIIVIVFGALILWFRSLASGPPKT